MFKEKWNKIVNFFDGIAKIAAGLIAIIAALSLYSPFASKLQYYYAINFNPTGFVYYGVNEQFELLPKGQLHLIKQGDRSYDDIEVGDKLQVSTNQNFREAPNIDKGAIFVLSRGDCVVVINKVEKISTLDGWLKVATTACGFFD